MKIKLYRDHELLKFLLRLNLTENSAKNIVTIAKRYGNYDFLSCVCGVYKFNTIKKIKRYYFIEF